MTSERDMTAAVDDLSRSLSELNKSQTASVDTLALAKDGVIILGNDSGRGNRYTTRYRIDRDKQRKAVRNTVQLKDCVPCVKKLDKPRSVRRWIWDIIRAEAFLLTLHIAVVALGSVKEALSFDEVAEDLHIAHSVLETVVTVIIVSIRMASARHGMDEVQTHRMRMEVWNRSVDPTSEWLTRRVRQFLIFSTILVLLNIAALFTLIFVEDGDLAWTIITNNTVLIIVGGLGDQVIGMLGKEMASMREDQHKAIIYECILLMTECLRANDTAEKKKAFAQAEHFCRALRDTELVQQPDYVTYASESSEMDLLSSLQVVSML